MSAEKLERKDKSRFLAQLSSPAGAQFGGAALHWRHDRMVTERHGLTVKTGEEKHISEFAGICM